MKYPIDILFGSIRIVDTSRIENGKLIFGGYTITLDRNGVEVSRTENVDNVILSFE